MFEFLAYQQPTTDSDNLRMAAIFFPIVFGAMAFYHTFVPHRKLRRLVRVLRDTPTSRIGDVEPGLREVTGQLLAADEELRSPLQGIPCIYYCVEATRYQTSGGDSAAGEIMFLPV